MLRRRFKRKAGRLGGWSVATRGDGQHVGGDGRDDGERRRCDRCGRRRLCAGVSGTGLSGQNFAWLSLIAVGMDGSGDRHGFADAQGERRGPVVHPFRHIVVKGVFFAAGKGRLKPAVRVGPEIIPAAAIERLGCAADRLTTAAIVHDETVERGCGDDQRRLKLLRVFANQDHFVKVRQNNLGQQAGLPFARLCLALDNHHGIDDQLVLGFGVGFGEEDHFAATLQVFQLDKSHLVALLCVDRAHACDEARQGDAFAVKAFIQLGARAACHLLQVHVKLQQRVADRIDAEQFLFPGQFFFTLYFFDRGQLDGRDMSGARSAHQVKHGKLARITCVVDRSRLGHHLFEDKQQLRTEAKAVESAGLDQEFERALADLAQVNAVAEILQAVKAAALVAGGEDGSDRPFADIFDGGHAEADGAASGDGEGIAEAGVALRHLHGFGRADLDVEVEAAVVDIGGQHIDTEAAALGDKVDHLFGLVALHEQLGGHILDWVIGLEPGGLDGDDGIIGGVAVVHQDVVGDKVVRARHFQIIGTLLAHIFDRDDAIPVDVAVGIAAQHVTAKVVGQTCDCPARKAVLAGRTDGIKFALRHAALLIDFQPGDACCLFLLADEFFDSQWNHIFAATHFVRLFLKAVNLAAAQRAYKVTGDVAAEQTEILAAGDEELIADAAIFVRKVDCAQAADDAKTQEQVLQLLCHALRRSGIEEAAPGQIDVTVALPHTADQQSNLAVVKSKDHIWNMLVQRILALDAKVLHPGKDAWLAIAFNAPGIDGKHLAMNADCASHVVELFGGANEIVALFGVLGVIIDGMGVAQVAFGEQMTECDDLVIGPLLRSLHRDAAWGGDLVANLQFFQQPPAVEGVEGVVGGGFNAAAQGGGETIDGLDAVVHHGADGAGHQLERVQVTGQGGVEQGGIAVEVLDAHKAAGGGVQHLHIARQAFIKTVACKKFNIRINFCGGIVGDAVLFAAGDEDFLVFFDLGGFFLADGAADQVGFARGVAGEGA